MDVFNDYEGKTENRALGKRRRFCNDSKMISTRAWGRCIGGDKKDEQKAKAVNEYFSCRNVFLHTSGLPCSMIRGW